MILHDSQQFGMIRYGVYPTYSLYNQTSKLCYFYHGIKTRIPKSFKCIYAHDIPDHDSIIKKNRFLHLYLMIKMLTSCVTFDKQYLRTIHNSLLQRTFYLNGKLSLTMKYYVLVIAVEQYVGAKMYQQKQHFSSFQIVKNGMT